MKVLKWFAVGEEMDDNAVMVPGPIIDSRLLPLTPEQVANNMRVGQSSTEYTPGSWVTTYLYEVPVDTEQLANNHTHHCSLNNAYFNYTGDRRCVLCFRVMTAYECP